MKTNKMILDEAYQKGKIVGRMISTLGIAKSLKENGISTYIISISTGLSETEIENL